MPSPLAHGALVLLAAPALPACPPRTFLCRSALLAVTLVFLCLPDVDILVSWIISGEPFRYHGGPSHSLLLAPLAGVLFAVLTGKLCDCSSGRRWVVGTCLYGSHVLMDALTRGRGVAMWWPLSDERIVAGWTPFYGVRHSQWRQWDLHLITLANEGAFVAVVGAAWVALILLKRRAETAPLSDVEVRT